MKTLLSVFLMVLLLAGFGCGKKEATTPVGQTEDPNLSELKQQFPIRNQDTQRQSESNTQSVSLDVNVTAETDIEKLLSDLEASDENFDDLAPADDDIDNF